MTIAAGQKILIDGAVTLGANATPASLLDLWPCYRLQGSVAAPTTIGSGTFDLRVPANIRTTFVQAGIATGLAAGTYQVGVCGKTDSGQGANWNNNEFGFVTALVF